MTGFSYRWYGKVTRKIKKQRFGIFPQAGIFMYFCSEYLGI